jgi:hypothetical protein
LLKEGTFHRIIGIPEHALSDILGRMTIIRRIAHNNIEAVADPGEDVGQMECNIALSVRSSIMHRVLDSHWIAVQPQSVLGASSKKDRDSTAPTADLDERLFGSYRYYVCHQFRVTPGIIHVAEYVKGNAIYTGFEMGLRSALRKSYRLRLKRRVAPAVQGSLR